MWKLYPQFICAQNIILGFKVPKWLYKSISVSLVILCSNVRNDLNSYDMNLLLDIWIRKPVKLYFQSVQLEAFLTHGITSQQTRDLEFVLPKDILGSLPTHCLADSLSYVTSLIFQWWLNKNYYKNTVNLENIYQQQKLFEGPEQKYKSYCQMKTWYHNQTSFNIAKENWSDCKRINKNKAQLSYVIETLAWWIFSTKIGFMDQIQFIISLCRFSVEFSHKTQYENSWWDCSSMKCWL